MIVPFVHARAGAIKEVGPAVAIDVADRQCVALDIPADAIAPQPDFCGNILELPGEGRRQSQLGQEVKSPIAVGLADLKQYGVLAGFQLQYHLGLIRCTGTSHILGQQLLAV